jgi:NTP pyrophosphatase (non-canonical NTP hydrolase)
MKHLNPWHPMTNTVDLKHLGKLAEELNECGSAVARCIIQGIDKHEPETGKLNKRWLEEEIADVIANASLVIQRFDLNVDFMNARSEMKKEHLRKWHEMA